MNVNVENMTAWIADGYNYKDGVNIPAVGLRTDEVLMVNNWPALLAGDVYQNGEEITSIKDVILTEPLTIRLRVQAISNGNFENFEIGVYKMTNLKIKDERLWGVIRKNA